MSEELVDRAALQARVAQTEADAAESLRRFNATRDSRNPIKRALAGYALWADEGRAQDAFDAFQNSYNQ